MTNASGDFAIIDSQTIADGVYGHGTFRLNPVTDGVMLVKREPYVLDSVGYPSIPSDRVHAPAPPPGGSISLFRAGDGGNWYVDSSGSPGDTNVHYGTIAGTVTADSGAFWEELSVVASGLTGGCFAPLGRPEPYAIGGLGPGRYLVEAWGFDYRAELLGHGVYPESVAIGYAQTVTGIDIAMSPVGIAEQPGRELAPRLKVRGGILEIICLGATATRLEVFDETGRNRRDLRLGRLTPGRHKIDLSRSLSPGVYFARLLTGTSTATAKLTVK